MEEKIITSRKEAYEDDRASSNEALFLKRINMKLEDIHKELWTIKWTLTSIIVASVFVIVFTLKYLLK